jgi:hypothetical protein
MKVIYKYNMYGPTATLSLPIGSKILSAGVENGFEIVVWVMQETEEIRYENRFIKTFSTGESMYEVASDEVLTFIGTTITAQNGDYVVHVFEITKDGEK